MFPSHSSHSLDSHSDLRMVMDLSLSAEFSYYKSCLQPKVKSSQTKNAVLLITLIRNITVEDVLRNRFTKLLWKENSSEHGFQPRGGVSNLRPGGQNQPAQGFNPGHDSLLSPHHLSCLSCPCPSEPLLSSGSKGQSCQASQFPATWDR